MTGNEKEVENYSEIFIEWQKIQNSIITRNLITIIDRQKTQLRMIIVTLIAILVGFSIAILGIYSKELPPLTPMPYETDLNPEENRLQFYEETELIPLDADPVFQIFPNDLKIIKDIPLPESINESE